MTHSFDTNSQEITQCASPKASAAIYDAFHIESTVFQNFVNNQDLAYEDHLTPEVWGIVKSHEGKLGLKKIHGIHKANLSTHLVLKDLPKDPNPFIERVKEIDPQANIVILGRLNLEADILGFTEDAVNPRATETYPVLSEAEAYKIFKQREYERNSFSYHNGLRVMPT